MADHKKKTRRKRTSKSSQSKIEQNTPLQISVDAPPVDAKANDMRPRKLHGKRQREGESASDSQREAKKQKTGHLDKLTPRSKPSKTLVKSSEQSSSKRTIHERVPTQEPNTSHSMKPLGGTSPEDPTAIKRKGERRREKSREWKVSREAEEAKVVEAPHPKKGEKRWKKEDNEVKLRAKSVKGLNPVKGFSDGNAKTADAILEFSTGASLTSNTNQMSGRRMNIPGARGWQISDAIGGRQIPKPPIFSKDENFILVAVRSAVRIYSTATSSLVRTIPLSSTLSQKTSIQDLVLSPTNPDHLYICSQGGLLQLWDWENGQILGEWQLGRCPKSISAVLMMSSGITVEIILTTESVSSGSRIVAYLLQHGNNQRIVESKEIFIKQGQAQIASLCVSSNGHVIIAGLGHHLLVGVREQGVEEEVPSTTSMGKEILPSLSYKWREMVVPKKITCFDLRVSSISSKGAKEKRKRAAPNLQIDVVTGNEDGSVYIYDDLLNRLIAHEETNPQRSGVSIVPRKQHWHREPVRTVAWSADGNYVISGGSESVLVLWQMDTNKQQYLPHLPSIIESAIVSPTGTSYALSLADNSIIVISTADLQAKCHIIGIQARYAKSAGQHGFNIPMSPSVVNPVHPSQLLLAAPSAQIGTSETGAPYLQTYDVSSSHQLLRQALAWTNITNKKIGGDFTRISEPEVKIVQISHDGEWLATVDTWAPPPKDLSHLTLDDTDLSEELDRHREIYLKFWSWHKGSHEWALVTRVDAPHASVSDEWVAGLVLDMVSDPTSHGFATVGEDGYVKLWRPKVRLQDGIVMRDGNKKELMSWSCRQIIPLDGVTQPLGSYPDSPGASVVGTLSFSIDGSLLVAALQRPESSTTTLIHFIDTKNGQVRHTREGITSGALIALGLLGRYLIALSDQLVVYDVVTDTVQYTHHPSSMGEYLVDKHVPILLSLQRSAETFAIALPLAHGRDSQPEAPNARVAVFDPKKLDPLCTVDLPHNVSAMHPHKTSNGYLVLDSAAEIRILSPKRLATLPIPPEPAALEDERTTTLKDIYSRLTGQKLLTLGGEAASDQDTVVEKGANLDLDFGGGPVLKVSGNTDEDENKDGDEDDYEVPVVPKEALTEVFDTGPAFAAPPLRDTFMLVADLYAQKPIARA